MSDITLWRDAAVWVKRNPVLASGQVGFERDTGKSKIGTGTAKWNDLPYSSSSTYVRPESSSPAVDVSSPSSSTAKIEQVGPWAELVRAAQFGLSYTGAIVGDSTGDNLGGTFEWPLLALQLLATRYSDVRMEHLAFNDGTQTYGAATVVNAGPAAAGGSIANDTFSVAGNAVGAAADTKGTWIGSGTVTKSGGTAAFSTGGALSVLCPSQDSTVTANLIVTTTGLSGVHAFRFATAFSNAGLTGFGVWGALSFINNTTTTINVVKQTNAGRTTVITETINLGLGNVTGKAVTIEAKLEGNVFTFTITVDSTVTTRSITLTEAERAEMGSYAGVNNNPGNGVGGMVLDALGVVTPVIPAPTIRLYNGSVAGKNPDYLRAAGRIAALFPVQMDGIFFSFGHNSHLIQGGPTEFLTDYGTTLDLVKAAQPNAKLIIGSQNPEFTPRNVSIIYGHAARQSLLRGFAKDRGLRYVPVYEAFRAIAADNGKAHVQADGVHPTNPPSITPADGYGSTLWAKTVVGV